MLSGVTPGPHELNADQLQQFMSAFVTDLLSLYENGIIVKTPAYPQGMYMFHSTDQDTYHDHCFYSFQAELFVLFWWRYAVIILQCAECADLVIML